MAADIATFQEVIWEYYRVHGRTGLPWRRAEVDGSFDPYKILVSELMLQQTQVSRVIPKYEAFLAKFPDAGSLARASLGEVLTAWSGLGYNRRAKFLWQAAQMVVQDFGGQFPHDVKGLVQLPGVGPNTAGAIAAYAFNQPVVFIETNIRTVFIHHFFRDQAEVSDKDILAFVAKTLPDEQGKEQPERRIYSVPDVMRKSRSSETAQHFLGRSTEDLSHYRLWYWSLMDYGTYLKQTVGNLNRASRSYTKQSIFVGSRRQLRGAAIRALLVEPYELEELAKLLPDDRLQTILAELVAEGLVAKTGKRFYII